MFQDELFPWREEAHSRLTAQHRQLVTVLGMAGVRRCRRVTDRTEVAWDQPWRVWPLEMAGIGFDNRILCQIKRLSYIRQPGCIFRVSWIGR